MKADTVDLAAIFGNQVRYMVPLYQRPYVWNREEQWEPLWQDILSVAERQLDGNPTNDAIPHFLGAVVLEQALVQSGKIHTRSVIDGQQRLTTLQLLLASARSVAAVHGQDDARRTFEKLLTNESFLVKHDGYAYKVLPTERDKAPFREAMQDGVGAATGEHRMHEAMRFFRTAINDWVTDGADEATIAARIEALSTVLWNRLIVVTIDLDPGDNAQIIFETLNARGTPLLAGDLIKNHLFQVATIQGAAVDSLYADHWRTLDTDWWRAEVQQGRLKRPRLDVFLNHWLAMRTGSEIVSHELFPAFKRHLAAGDKSAESVLADLEVYARVYESFEREPEQTALGRFLYRLGVMEVTTAYPALLWLLGPEGITDSAEREVALAAIESWLVRRMLTRSSTKNYNVVFLALLNAVRGRGERSPNGSDVEGFLGGLTGESQAWPVAADVLSSLRGLPAYTALTRSRLRMVLEALEEASSSGLTEKVVLPHDLTIEHVLPQEWGAHWPLAVADDPVMARARRDAAKHTLGNLTLVTGRLNPKMSNAAWLTKREALRQFSVMRISTDLRDAETWDEAAIARRGDRLANLTVSLWARPDDVIDERTGQLGDPAVPQPARTPELIIREGDAAFAAPFAIADSAGVGVEIRVIVRSCQEAGLTVRPDKYSVMVSPPSDRRVMLFTVWPQAEEGGSFRIFKSPRAFSQHVAGLSLESAVEALGASEAQGLLRAADVGLFLDAVRTLVGDRLISRRPEDDASSTMDDLTTPAPDQPAADVSDLIDLRASSTSGRLAREFVRMALEIDGVTLQVQNSKSDPWYFQVRHPRFAQVVAYVHPRPQELHIEYRLPASHDTYAMARSRANVYGIVLKVKSVEDLPIAERLLRDAMSREA